MKWKFNAISQAMIDLNDPALACEFGVEEHPLYLKCDKCKNLSWCERGQTLQALEESRRICEKWNIPHN